MYSYEDRVRAARLDKVLVMPPVRERLLALGIEPSPVSPAEFNQIFLTDRELMVRIVKESGISRD